MCVVDVRVGPQPRESRAQSRAAAAIQQTEAGRDSGSLAAPAHTDYSRRSSSSGTREHARTLNKIYLFSERRSFKGFPGEIPFEVRSA